jgi:hypothetical protein
VRAAGAGATKLAAPRATIAARGNFELESTSASIEAMGTYFGLSAFARRQYLR